MTAGTHDAVRRVAGAEKLLVALDFDGTLSALEDEPMDARMLPATRSAVERLAALPDTVVAFVSGRSLDDLRTIAEHGDDSAVALSGSHGAEWWIPGEGRTDPEIDPADLHLRDRLRARLDEMFADRDGVWIEPKTFGFAVHTRLADDETSAAANDEADALVTAEAPHWRRRTGQDIVEYAFRHEGKDTAVQALRERTGATAVVFAGDDVTDEDALRSLGENDLGVHVGARETAATVRVADVAAFAAFLDGLAAERASARQ